jgi:hypothetical protein
MFGELPEGFPETTVEDTLRDIFKITSDNEKWASSGYCEMEYKIAPLVKEIEKYLYESLELPEEITGHYRKS